MDGSQRRKELIEILSRQTEPISGTELASRLKVSRQVIVQDIALIRAENKSVLSTNKGYLLCQKPESKKVSCEFMVRHSTEQMEDELYTFVDYGGKVLNVVVRHPVYGVIATDLILATREDVKEFVRKVNKENTIPLKQLTNDIHSHKVEAESKEILEKIHKELEIKGYLYAET